MLKTFDRIAAVGGKDKGGLHLSTSMCAMATVLRATGEGIFDVHAVDADGFNKTMTQWLAQRDSDGQVLAHQDPAKGVQRADLFDRDGVAPMWKAVESEAKFVLIDTPAGAIKKFRSISANLTARHFVNHIRANGREPIVLLPFTPTIAAVRSVGEALKTFGDDVTYVAARSLIGVTEGDHRLWTTEPFRDRFNRMRGGVVRRDFEQAGGRLIDMPAAEVGSLVMAEALGLSFGDAPTYTGPDWEGYDQMNIAAWLESWVEQLRTIEDLLGLVGANWKAY